MIKPAKKEGRYKGVSNYITADLFQLFHVKGSLGDSSSRALQDAGELDGVYMPLKGRMAVCSQCFCNYSSVMDW